MGGTESGHPYLDVASKPKNYGPQSYEKLKKEPEICQIFHLKNWESFDESWQNGGCFWLILHNTPFLL